MKRLADGTMVRSMTYYFLLDWNDINNKIYMADTFKKQRLCDLNINDYATLFLYATNVENVILLELANEERNKLIKK